MNSRNGNQEPVSDEPGFVWSDHPEPEKIVAYRVGELTAEEDERLWKHLEECGECVDLMLLGMDDPAEEDTGALDFEKELVWLRLKQQRTAEKVKKQSWYERVGVAAAAVLVLGLPLGGLALHQKTVIADLTRPQLNTAIHDAMTITPRIQEQRLYRAVGEVGSLEEQQPRVLKVPAGTDFYTVIFSLGPQKAEEVYRVEILDAEGREVWSGEGLKADQLGFATLGLSRQFLDEGSYEFRVFNEKDAEEPVGDYLIRIRYL